MSKITLLGVLGNSDYCLELTGTESDREVSEIVTLLKHADNLLGVAGSTPKSKRSASLPVQSASPSNAKSLPDYIKPTYNPIAGKCEVCYTDGSLIVIKGRKNGNSYTRIKCDHCKEGYYTREN